MRRNSFLSLLSLDRSINDLDEQYEIDLMGLPVPIAKVVKSTQ